MTISLSPTPASSFTEHVRNFISLLKVILDQGNPFPEQHIASLKSKILSITFMLIGIVHSNAYKNTNVYNMILPRSPLPLEYFWELVERNFIVYTSATSLKMTDAQSYQGYQYMFHKCNGFQLLARNGSYDYCIKTAVDRI